MLANALNEFRSGIVYPDGLRADDALIPLKRRLAKAQVFLLDRDAVAMAANVALSKPTSILSALPWVRLPFESTWIEFVNADLRDAMRDLGSPNLPPSNTVSRIVRTGFLLRMEEGDLVIDYVHEDEYQGRRLIDLAPVRPIFRLREDPPDLPPDIPKGRGGADLARGRLRETLRLATTDPAEAGAARNLRQRFSWELHPDMAGVAASLARMAGADRVDRIQQDQAQEAYRLFTLAILPALILLNCRNAVAAERVAAPERLNKKRAAKGRPPLVEHILVKVSLSAGQRRRAESAGGGTTRWIRGTLVRGHFKVRKTGIFWWSPHARSGYGAVTRTHVVTR